MDYQPTPDSATRLAYLKAKKQAIMASNTPNAPTQEQEQAPAQSQEQEKQQAQSQEQEQQQAQSQQTLDTIKRIAELKAQIQARKGTSIYRQFQLALTVKLMK